jgi:hypothetical protein
MTRAEWIEVAIIASASLASLALPLHVLSDLTLGEVVLYLSALLLAQGLARDLVMLLLHRSAAQGGVFQESQCLCLESAVGVTGVVVGASLFVSANSHPVAVTTTLGVAGAVALTLAAGFLIKDLVITWNPLGIRREKNPLSVIIRSRR